MKQETGKGRRDRNFKRGEKDTENEGRRKRSGKDRGKA